MLFLQRFFSRFVLNSVNDAHAQERNSCPPPLLGTPQSQFFPMCKHNTRQRGRKRVDLCPRSDFRSHDVRPRWATIVFHARRGCDETPMRDWCDRQHTRAKHTDPWRWRAPTGIVLSGGRAVLRGCGGQAQDIARGMSDSVLRTV